MPQSSVPLPREVRGWPDPVRLAAAPVPAELARAAVLLARWLEAVRSTMKEQGLPQTALAERAGLGLRTVSRILGGGAWPEFPTLVALSTTTRVPLPGGGGTAVLDPTDHWPVCTACDALLVEEFYSTPVRAKLAELDAAFEVVMTNHGRVWTGVRCEWMERLRRHGYGWLWPPNNLSAWEDV